MAATVVDRRAQIRRVSYTQTTIGGTAIGRAGRRQFVARDGQLPREQLAATSLTPKAVNLALQGGGAHGAITWGVLDRLLEDARITFDGISATSAGAMNAVALAYGWTIGGREAAKSALARFWDGVRDIAGFGRLEPSRLDWTRHDSLRAWPGSGFMDLMSRSSLTDMLTGLFSPYEFNPLNINPLRDLLTATVDFEALRSPHCPIKLFISATNVRTGKIKIFEGSELTADMVMASACLPQLFHAVEIDGEHYWDGGLVGNPAIFPLIHNCANRDILVVRVSPFFRQEAPRSAREIRERTIEISLNAALIRELGVIALVTQLIDGGHISDDALRQVRLHCISADEAVTNLPRDSRLCPDGDYLRVLRDVGRRQADAWLDANFAMLGRTSTIDFRKEFARSERSTSPAALTPAATTTSATSAFSAFMEAFLRVGLAPFKEAL